MSNVALDLLIEYEFLQPSGKINNLSKISTETLGKRIALYANARKQMAISEIFREDNEHTLNALFSTTSTNITKQKLMSSLLIYNSIAIDDPILNYNQEPSIKQLHQALKFYSWCFNLIRAGFIKTLPISFIGSSRKVIPILKSDDAFKSSVPSKLHDFIHKSAQLKSVIRDDNGHFLILNEQAERARRPAIHVSFLNDYWEKGVSLYLFQTIENSTRESDDTLHATLAWNPNETLSKEKFDHWKYQVVNQAIRARLLNIRSECELAGKLGHTYITESSFESRLLSETDIPTDTFSESAAAKFLEANNTFIKIESPTTIIELRTKFSKAFERFQYSLIDISTRLATTSPEAFNKEARRLFHVEILPQIDEIRASAALISSGTVKGVLSSLGGFAVAFATGSPTPLFGMLMSNVAAGLTETLPNITQHESMKNRPSYIWHRIIKN